MKEANIDILNATEHLLYNIHMGQHRQINNRCKSNILWKYNHNCSKGIMNKRIIISINTIIQPSEVKKLEHLQYYIHRLFTNHVIITGIYCIHKSEESDIKKYYFDYTIIFSGGLACYIQIFGNNIPTKIHKVVDVTEDIYNIQEDNLLYVESMHGHVVWHCNDTVMESVDLLKDIEANLSEDFVKVHRSYIVNKKWIKSVQRCSVTMMNGDVIPVPYKKYVEVKKMLLKT